MNMGIGRIKRQFLNVEHCRDDMLLFPDQVSEILEGGPSCQDDGGTITQILSTCAQKDGRES